MTTSSLRCALDLPSTRMLSMQFALATKDPNPLKKTLSLNLRQLLVKMNQKNLRQLTRINKAKTSRSRLSKLEKRILRKEQKVSNYISTEIISSKKRIVGAKVFKNKLANPKIPKKQRILSLWTTKEEKGFLKRNRLLQFLTTYERLDPRLNIKRVVKKLLKPL